MPERKKTKNNRKAQGKKDNNSDQNMDWDKLQQDDSNFRKTDNKNLKPQKRHHQKQKLNKQT